MTPSERERLNKELADILQECSVHDWNGYGAEPIHPDSVTYMRQFLECIPEGFHIPQVAAEPHGGLGVYWHRKGFSISLGIDANKELSWGGVTPCGRVHGSTIFEGVIPEEVLKLLYEIEGKKMKIKNSKGFTWVIGLGGCWRSYSIHL